MSDADAQAIIAHLNGLTECNQPHIKVIAYTILGMLRSGDEETLQALVDFCILLARRGVQREIARQILCGSIVPQEAQE